MLADRVASRRDATRAAQPVSEEEFASLLGSTNGMSARSKSGVSVSAKRALGLSSWYSGVRFISEVIAGLPVHRYKNTPTGRVRVADPEWMTNPDTEQPWYGWVEFTMMMLLHRGNAITYKKRDPITQQVIGLRELHLDRITMGQAPDGLKRFLVDRDETPYTTRDILHIPGLSYDGRIGMNPIAYNADVLGAAVATDDFAGRFFANGTHVGGVISVQEMMTEDQAKELASQWDRFHQGLINAHMTGVLSKGATYNRVSLNAADTQLLESRAYGVLEMARLLRLPPHKLYEMSAATFSNIEHQSIESVTDGIQPWCERLEAHINYDRDLTPEGTFIEFQLEGRLRGDTTTRFAAYTSAIGRPWMVPNEARRLENLPAVDGGDDLMSPLNMSSTSDIKVDPREIAEISQKIYLSVANGVLTPKEARQQLIAAGADIPPDFPGGPA